MKRIALCFAAASLALLFSVPVASAFGWKDVVKMHRAGIADSLIIQKIEYSGKTFHLDADEMAALTDEGVSDAVISAMLRTEAEAGEGDDYYGSYGYPYYHSRAYLGWGYYPRYYSRGYYPYYGHYSGYRYPRSYVRYGRPSGDYGTTRERTQVGSRLAPRTNSGSGTQYRTRPQAGPSPRSGRSGSSGSSGGRTRQR